MLEQELRVIILEQVLEIQIMLMLDLDLIQITGTLHQELGLITLLPTAQEVAV